jgi:hypothetical protein
MRELQTNGIFAAKKESVTRAMSRVTLHFVETSFLSPPPTSLACEYRRVKAISVVTVKMLSRQHSPHTEGSQFGSVHVQQLF